MLEEGPNVKIQPGGLKETLKINSINHIIRKCTASDKLSESQENINNLMYMDDIKLFAKSEKRIENPYKNCENIQSWYKNGIWHRKMRHATIETWQTVQDGKGRTIKSISDQNARRKENLQIFGDIGSWHNQEVEIKEKFKKEYKKKKNKKQKANRDKTL